MENARLIKDEILKLERLILHTPLIPFNIMEYDQSCIYLKPENLQIFGSYKIRGIVSVLNELANDLLVQGLAAASAGNMAQAVAFAARSLQIPCRIYLPESAPKNKKLAIQNLGAEIIEMPYENIWKIVKGETQLSDKGVFIHPALNKFLLKGYATIANEIITDMPDVDAVVIPFGVGGLSLGIGQALKKFNPNIAVYTCEPETAAPLHKSIKNNKLMSINRVASFVDAIGTPEVLPQVFEQVLHIISDSLVVSLKSAQQALKQLYFNNKLICEGAAACSLAAAIELKKTKKYNKIICILSGGNIDFHLLNNLIND